MKRTEKTAALAELKKLYYDAKPALKFSSPYELLVAVILSAQCTDERVNKVTKILFQRHNTPQTMLLLTQAELEKYIFSCGFYRMKAEHILSASRDILHQGAAANKGAVADFRTRTDDAGSTQIRGGSNLCADVNPNLGLYLPVVVTKVLSQREDQILNAG